MPRAPRASIRSGNVGALNDIPTMISPARRAEIDRAARAKAKSSAPRRPRETKAQKAEKARAEARRMPIVRPSTIPSIVRRPDSPMNSMEESNVIEGEYIPAERPVVPVAQSSGETIEGSLPEVRRSTNVAPYVMNALPVETRQAAPAYAETRQAAPEMSASADVESGGGEGDAATYEEAIDAAPEPDQGQVQGTNSSKKRAGRKSPLSALTQIGRMTVKLLRSINNTLKSMLKQNVASTKAAGLASRQAKLKNQKQNDTDAREKSGVSGSGWLSTIVGFLLPALMLGIKPVMEGIRKVVGLLGDGWQKFKSMLDDFKAFMSKFIPQPIKDAAARVQSGVENLLSGATGRNVGRAIYNRVNGSLVDRVIHQESRGNPNAINARSGARGVMQVMPATAVDPGMGAKNVFQIADSLGVPYKDKSIAEAKRLLMNPDVNKAMGTGYLNALSAKYGGNEADLLVAYNWGAGNADKWIKNGRQLSALPDETRDYVQKILGRAANSQAVASTRPQARPVVTPSMLEQRSIPTPGTTIVVPQGASQSAQQGTEAATNVTPVPSVSYVPSPGNDTSYDWLQYHSYA